MAAAGGSRRIAAMATVETDYYAILGLERRRDATPRSSAPSASSPSSGIPTSTRTPRPRRASRRSTRPTRSSPTRNAARRYDLFGRAAVGGREPTTPGSRASVASATSSTPSSAARGAAGAARRGRPPAGSDLRYDLRITFEEAIRGTEKEIEFPALGRCATCEGNGAAPGTHADRPARSATAGARSASVRQTMLGQMVNVTACPRCRGEGRIVETPCETCKGDGRTEHKRTLRVTIPPGIDEGHQIRLSNEGEAGPRGGPPAACTSRSTSCRTRPCERDGTELYFDLSLGLAQAALGTRISCRPSTARRRSRSRPGRSRGRRSGSAAGACPHLRRADTAATST